MPESLCIIYGCQKPQKCRGWCHAHYRRWKAYGDPEALSPVDPPVIPDHLQKYLDARRKRIRIARSRAAHRSLSA